MKLCFQVLLRQCEHYEILQLICTVVDSLLQGLIGRLCYFNVAVIVFPIVDGL